MTISEYSGAIVRELQRTLPEVSDMEAEHLVGALLERERIFTGGGGRSGYMMKAFAMRLMHLGLESHVVGETVTPNLRRSDLLLIGSGSGETASLVAAAEKARGLGAAVGLITIFPDSSIGGLADIVVRIPAPTPKVPASSSASSIQPMGSLFEQGLLLLLDAVVLRLMERLEEGADTMFTRHANLE